MNNKGRTLLVALFIVSAFVGLGTRLVFLHLKPADSTLARIETGRHLEVKMSGPRGQILDRNGNILAVDIPVRHLCADPQFILKHGDIHAVCKALTHHLPINHSELWKLLDQPQRQYVRIQKWLREKMIDPLRALNLKGLIFEEATLRHYPSGIGAHVIGFANHEGVGSAGVEQKMDSHLQGSPGLRISKKDGRRREIYGERIVDIEAQPGANIYLTLDQQLQHFVEKELDELVRKYQPKGAWAIVQNVRTGEILAMASWPTFNLNRFSSAPPEWMRNRTVNYTYEPGSVMKAVIIASALDSGTVQAQDRFDCENGRWMYGGKMLHDSHGEGRLTVADILKKSSNIGAAKIALKMGNQNVYKSLQAFGFGARTGLDLPGEDAGILWNPKKWSKISATRLSMGHEILVTSMQMLSAFSTIANDGIRMRPFMVQKVVDGQGKTLFESPPVELGRPIRPETAAKMRRLLARVTQPGGTGTQAALRGYLVAGKTGTAQKVDLEKGGYYKNKYIASFAGFLPMENPAISIIVVADDPQGAHYGGTVCAPAFRSIADQAVRYLRISPQGFPTEYVNPRNRFDNEQ